MKHRKSKRKVQSIILALAIVVSTFTGIAPGTVMTVSADTSENLYIYDGTDNIDNSENGYKYTKSTHTLELDGFKYRGGSYGISYSGSASYTINKAANTLSVKAGKEAVVSYSKVKNSNQALAIKKVLTVTNNKGSVTYTKQKGNAGILIDKKTGKITVKKGLSF